jgi:hypothetical protein
MFANYLEKCEWCGSQGQGNADFQIRKHELYCKPTRKPGNTVFDSLTRRVTKLRSFKN